MFKAAILVALLSASVPTLGLAQTADDLRNDERTPGDVLTYGMGYSQQRYSPLTHIDRGNVKPRGDSSHRRQLGLAIRLVAGLVLRSFLSRGQRHKHQ